MTALMSATEMRRDSVVIILLQRGADLSLGTADGTDRTAIDLADNDVTRALLAQGLYLDVVLLVLFCVVVLLCSSKL